MGRLLVVTGTATEIGKTHLSEALLRHLGETGRRAAGVKPVESGVGDGVVTDAARLAAASSFHVKHQGVALPEPISPHRAARHAGVTLDVDAMAHGARALLPDVDLLLVELPGGLFTPLTDTTVNADLALRLRPDALLLVAPDRLGVLHDVLAATRAAAAAGLEVTGVALVAPEHRDASTGTNAEELARVAPVPVLAVVPRASAAALAATPELGLIARALLR